MAKNLQKTKETRNQRIGISVTSFELKLLKRIAKREKESMTEILMRALKNYEHVKQQPEIFKE